MMLFLSGNHNDLRSAVNAIGASVAIFTQEDNKQFSIVSANELFTEITDIDVSSMIGASQTSVESEVVIDRAGQQRWWRIIFSPVISDRAK